MLEYVVSNFCTSYTSIRNVLMFFSPESSMGGKAAAAQVNNAGFKATLTFERRAISE